MCAMSLAAKLLVLFVWSCADRFSNNLQTDYQQSTNFNYMIIVHSLLIIHRLFFNKVHI